MKQSKMRSAGVAKGGFKVLSRVVERNILSARDLCRSGGVHGGRNCGAGVVDEGWGSLCEPCQGRVGRRL